MKEYSKELELIASKIKTLSPKAVAKRLRVIAEELEEKEAPEIREYRKLLNKIKNKDGIKKLKIFLDNPRLRKPIRHWLVKLDEGEGAGAVDFMEMMKKVKLMLKRDLPAAKFLKMVLDYGVANGHVALDRMLSKGRAKITLMKEKK